MNAGIRWCVSMTSVSVVSNGMCVHDFVFVFVACPRVWRVFVCVHDFGVFCVSPHEFWCLFLCAPMIFVFISSPPPLPPILPTPPPFPSQGAV